MAGASQAAALIEVALRDQAKNTIRKQYNLVELCLSMHGFGVGKRFTRKSWDWYQPNSYFTVSRIVVKRMEPNLKRARIYGHLTWKGKTQEVESQAACNLKREWKLHETNAPIKLPDFKAALEATKKETKKEEKEVQKQ